VKSADVCTLPSRDAMRHCLASLYYSTSGRDDNKKRRNFLMVSLNCSDLGMNYSFELTGTDERDVMRQFIHYAETELKMPVLTADTIYRVKMAIKK
jgi:predicted small metal-binding protein